MIKGAEPFGFEGDENGVLLVHGFTGSPQGMRYWGEYLAKAGFTVSCPRLPGHGTDPKDLHRVTAQDWIDEAEMSLRGLLERCSNVFVGALSMGGSIALDLAARSPQVKALALVNPMVFSDDSRVKLAPLLGKVPLLLKGVGNDVADPAERELAYSKISTKAAASMFVMYARVLAELPKVTCPTIVFSSNQDHVVTPANSRRIIDGIGSKVKELVPLERSYHVATLDYDKELIFERSASFFREHAKA